jgi:hypothetical protein
LGIANDPRQQKTGTLMGRGDGIHQVIHKKPVLRKAFRKYTHPKIVQSDIQPAS